MSRNAILMVAIAGGLWLLMQGGGSIGAQLGSITGSFSGGGGSRDPYDQDPSVARAAYRAASPFNVQPRAESNNLRRHR